MRIRIFFTLTIVLSLLGISSIFVKNSWTASGTISSVPTTQKVVAITIDDGPHNKTTPEILAVLKEKKVHATFFILGENGESNPGLIARENAEGHEISSHGYSHKHLTKLSKDQIKEELERTENLIRQYAPKPLLFRPPGGLYNQDVLEVVRNRGYSTILWTVDPHDWARPTVKETVDRVMSQVKPGSIILLHDGQYPLPTPKALGIIIDRLKEEGYEMVTISELFQYYEVRTSHFWDFVFD
ncbi:MAG TPA: polysaccharide deacetylase family protein [Methylomusa anaerophila]|uniref:Peptidoglycan-N-acetylglucosamine deacetylase n=1 Tax=Methylomusa anaerophila TaxID=1930071 RepID=A0A348AG71_9FIRM|nr:polysaccharide deacetylase family protein [Methylomusa anaerophila]BBB90069.1 peptidoglycan-N-acetylglucosamine deacetylase [Methylomusa anaerophila]HML88205.1 polysaccharide deacetylase family protein [Methylomusa anaerophila]